MPDRNPDRKRSLTGHPLNMDVITVRVRATCTRIATLALRLAMKFEALALLAMLFRI